MNSQYNNTAAPDGPGIFVGYFSAHNCSIDKTRAVSERADAHIMYP